MGGCGLQPPGCDQLTDAAASVAGTQIMNQLYYPPDHLYALYMPLFVPIIVPLLSAILGQRRRCTTRRRRQRCKMEAPPAGEK